MIMKKSNDYWKKRQEELQKSLLEPADKYCKELEKAYKNTIKDIEKDVAVWYQRFADNNGIVDKVAAKRILNNKELKELKWDVNQYIKAGKENGITKDWSKELENASARYHISRLEALKIQMQQKIEELYGGREDKVKGLLGDIYTEGNYKNAYEIAQKTGAHFSFAKIDDGKLNKVLSKPWTADDNTFSEKIWQNRKTLVNTVHQELIKGISRGTAPITVANVIAKKMNTDLYKAQRLVITESAFFASEAQKDCYNNLDVDKYEILGTLDTTTCSECGGMDGQVFDVKDMVEGVNAPPFHPNCRCTTVPYFNDEFTEDEMRAARDEDGKTVYVKNMTYNEWKEKFIEEKGQQNWDYHEKSNKNKSADMEQYEKYKAVLGKNAPKTLEEFQKIKYNGNETWNQFKAYTNSIKSGELTPLADFSLYKSKCLEVSNTIIGITTANGIKIENRTNHLIARVIGSVENKRSGVEVADILRALKEPSYIKPIKYLVNGPSQKFVLNGVCIASVNPDTKTIIQVNPFTRKKGS